jgi:D-alanyl-lipoteichoic acid acyltransferase DltB (MBOAT superfamily)
MKKFIASAMLMGPVMAFAQVSGPLGTTLTTFKAIIDFLIPLMLALAVLVFFWGLVKYIANASDEAAKESGKTLMIWGMIALFVMVAFWGIIGYVQNSLGITGAVTTVTGPSVNMVPTI